MRFAILGDTHFGVRSANPIFFYHQEKFFDQFFQYLIDNHINMVFQLGDLFDNRRVINTRALQASRRMFFDKLHTNQITMYALVGNHDIFFKESLEINTPSSVLGEYMEIIVVDEPTTIQVDDTSIDLIPWICKANQELVLGHISSSKSDLCFGHFELAGFEMYRGMPSSEGMDSNLLAKYELVCSGHFHAPSRKDNIVYVGTPYELTWQDYGDHKGFYVFDTETRQLELVPTQHQAFVRLEYDEGPLSDISSLDLTNKYVKIVTHSKNDLYQFDVFLNEIQAKEPYEVRVIETTAELRGDVIQDESVNLEDTLDILSKYVDSIETNLDKRQVKTFMNELYAEAILL